METHRRLALCPAALEDGKLGPSTRIEVEREDRKGRGHNQEGGVCLVFVTVVSCMSQCVFTVTGDVACSLTLGWCLSHFLSYSVKHYNLIFQ